MAWSNQLAGAGTRLAKRAWVILQHHDRVNPVELAKAWGDPSDLSQWLKRYRRYGLAGLLDAQRGGRPCTSALVADALLKLMADQTASEGLLSDWIKADRCVKEATWRQARALGSARIERSGRTLDIPLPVAPGLRELVAVFADGKGLIVVATMDRLEDYIDSLSGTWISVPSVAKGALHGLRQTLTHALDVRFPTAKTTGPGMTSLLQRLAERTATFSALRKHSVQVHVIVDLRKGQNLPQVLQRFRDCGLWTPSTLADSKLGQMKFAVHDASPAIGMQMTLPVALEKANPSELGNLIDGLRAARTSPFLWLREL